MILRRNGAKDAPMMQTVLRRGRLIPTRPRMGSKRPANRCNRL